LTVANTHGGALSDHLREGENYLHHTDQLRRSGLEAVDLSLSPQQAAYPGPQPQPATFLALREQARDAAWLRLIDEKWLRQELVRRRELERGPYGPRRVTYADYTTSGRSRAKTKTPGRRPRRRDPR
jgi:hypothetical protein